LREVSEFAAPALLAERDLEMIPRKELMELLQKRLRSLVPGDKVDQIANEILELEGGWEEMNISHQDMGYSTSVSCPDICWLADQVDQGAVIKLYRKKKPQGT
jgi:hypothetical protein